MTSARIHAQYGFVQKNSEKFKNWATSLRLHTANPESYRELRVDVFIFFKTKTVNFIYFNDLRNSERIIVAQFVMV